MKSIFKKLVLSVFALAFFITPSLVDAKEYTLSDGDTFEGTEQEYKYVEFLLQPEPKIPQMLKDAWDKTRKGYKFPTTEDIKATAVFAGDAGYDPVTDEYYVSNSKGTGRVTFVLKHKLTRTKASKLLSKFVKELEVVLTKLEKDAKVKPINKIKPDSDFDYFFESFNDIFYDVGYNLGLALTTAYVDVEGKTNKTTTQQILVYSVEGKTNNPPIEIEKPDLYIDASPTFKEPFIFEQNQIMYKPLHMNVEVDSKAAPNTQVRFKIKDVRALPTVLATDIWPEMYE